MNEQLISVIVAVYNVESYLNKCVESIVNQTYRELEIILVDDGSTDSSGSICDEWAKKDSRVHVLHKQNGGLSDARNCGICVAHGKWICFVDGDDYIDILMYETLFNNRVENGMTVCGFYLAKEYSNYSCTPAVLDFNSKQAAEFYMNNELVSLRLGTPTYFGSYAWNKIYDRRLFLKVAYPKGRKFEDLFVILELLKYSSRIKFIPYCGYYYIQRANSITHSFKTIQTDSLEARIKQKQEFQQFWGIKSQKINQLIAIEYFSILRQYALLTDEMKKKFKDVRRDAWSALKDIGYHNFTIKMKIKLILCLTTPKLYRYLYKLNSNSII